ncbi:MAG: FadR family transcriptional regulator [Oscillibacter sp.]|nr:FadR family transcriptional regulator [Oscillibacter sp.]
MERDILSGIKNVKQSSQSLPEQVAEQISKLIIERRLSAGEQLPNEFELAEQLNVGRGSVREAVKILAARNVLELRRGKGTFIASNTGMVDDPFGFAYLEDEYRLAQELFAIRQQMEPWIASLAAERATAEDVADLRRLQHSIEDMIHRGEYYLYEDQRFHARIADCTGNRVLPMMIPVITYSVHLFGTLTQMTLLQETIDTHAQIVDAIEAHDPAAAHAAMEEHLRHNRMALPQNASKSTQT